MNDKVLIVDDSRTIRILLATFLKLSGYEIAEAENGEDGLQKIGEFHPNLILLDIMMPGIDGYEVCQRIKADPSSRDIPVIFLSGKSEAADKIRGLAVGGADYITKPFDTGELIARIKAVLRRSTWESEKNVLHITPGFLIDFNRYEVTIENKRADLTLTEFKILQLLTKRPGWVYNRSQILDYLWGNDKVVIERTVDVHIRNLRDKLGAYAVMIRNIRGVGYQFSLITEDELG